MMESTIYMIATTLLSILVGVYLGWPSQKGKWYRLLRSEAHGMIFNDMGPPGLESKFRLLYANHQSIEEVVEYLKTRIEQIATKNPWMLGKLRRNWFQPAVWVDDDHESVDISKIFRVVKVKSLQDRPRLIFCKTGKKILETGGADSEPLVKFALLYTEGSDEYVLTLTIPHFVGAAKSLYDIWGQLDCRRTEVKEFIFDRVDHHDGDSLTLLKGEAKKRLVNFMIYSDVGLFLRPQAQKAGQYVITSRKIRKEWIDQKKKEHKPTKDIPYLTSNDIINAWFFNQIEEGPEKVLMVYDTSSKSKNVSDQHIGNYTDSLLLYKEEYTDASEIHKAVASQGESLEKRPFPERSVGISSSWTRHYQDVQMPKSQRLHHMQIQGYVSSGDGLITTPAIVTFKTDKDEMAMVAFTKKLLKDYDPLGESLGWKS